MSKSVALISISQDLGAGRRGVDMGPSAIRIAGLVDAVEAMGSAVNEIGTVTARDPETLDQGREECPPMMLPLPGTTHEYRTPDSTASLNALSSIWTESRASVRARIESR